MLIRWFDSIRVFSFSILLIRYWFIFDNDQIEKHCCFFYIYTVFTFWLSIKSERQPNKNNKSFSNVSKRSNIRMFGKGQWQTMRFDNDDIFDNIFLNLQIKKKKSKSVDWHLRFGYFYFYLSWFGQKFLCTMIIVWHWQITNHKIDKKKIESKWKQGVSTQSMKKEIIIIRS